MLQPPRPWATFDTDIACFLCVVQLQTIANRLVLTKMQLDDLKASIEKRRKREAELVRDSVCVLWLVCCLLVTLICLSNRSESKPS